MAQALFVTTADVKKYTSLNGNVDNDLFIQFIKIAQDTHILQKLGTDLFNKINNDIVASTLTGNYSTLVETFIKPMLIHWSIVEYLPFAAYSVANKGIFKHTSENAESVSREEVNFMVEKYRDIAENYTQRFLDHMCNNNNLYPEYSTNSGEDVQPDKNNNFSGWVI